MPNRYVSRLRYAVRRASSRPAFMAYYLERFRQEQGWNLLALARWLGCRPASRYIDLALCLTPLSAEPGFSAGVRRLAQYSGVAPDKIVQVLHPLLAAA